MTHLDADYEDYDDYADPIDRRWIWVAGVAGVILLVAVICTVVILGGGDSGSVSKTISPPAAPVRPRRPRPRRPWPRHGHPCRLPGR